MLRPESLWWREKGQRDWYPYGKQFEGAATLAHCPRKAHGGQGYAVSQMHLNQIRPWENSRGLPWLPSDDSRLLQELRECPPVGCCKVPQSPIGPVFLWGALQPWALSWVLPPPPMWFSGYTVSSFKIFNCLTGVWPYDVSNSKFFLEVSGGTEHRSQLVGNFFKKQVLYSLLLILKNRLTVKASITEPFYSQ